MSEMEKLLNAMEAFKAVQEAQNDTIGELAKANIALKGQVTALLMFAHSVTQNHQDMQYLVMTFHKMVEGAQNDPELQHALHDLGLLQETIVRAAAEKLSAQDHPD